MISVTSSDQTIVNDWQQSCIWEPWDQLGPVFQKSISLNLD